MNQQQQRPMKANELVGFFAGLLKIDIAHIASVVGNIPRANLNAWLAGKKENLRVGSVLRLLELVGLRVTSHGVRLDPERVHFLYIDDGMFRRNAYQSLAAISKLLEMASIARVEPPQRGWWSRRRSHTYLISDGMARVVVVVRKSIFKNARVSPDLIRGTVWSEYASRRGAGSNYGDHIITTTAAKWQLLASRDMAPHEFDQIFMLTEPKMGWGDVALLSREYGVTPDAAHQMILDRFRPKGADRPGSYNSASDASKGTVDLHEADRAVMYLAHDAARRQAAA